MNKNNEFKINNKAHEKEHSIEVQLPFVQHIFKNVQIIPIVYGNIDEQKIANAIAYILPKDIINGAYENKINISNAR